METHQKPLQAAVKPGIIIGLVLTVVTYLLYFVDYSLLASQWTGLVSLAIYVGMVIYFGIQYRKEIGGFINFGPAFLFSFYSSIIMTVVSTIGSMLLFLVLDPGLGEKMADIGLQNTVEIMDRFGAGDAISTDQLDEIREGIVQGYTFVGLIKSAGIVCVFYAFVSLILGAIIKKKDKSRDF